MIAEFGLAVCRQPRGHVIAEGLSDFLGLLAFDEAEGDLGGSLRRDDRFRTLTGVAADNAIDIAGRARGYLLDQQAILFAGGNRKPDRLEKRLRREIEILPLGEDVRRQVLHAVVEAGDGDMAVLVEQ